MTTRRPRPLVEEVAMVMYRRRFPVVMIETFDDYKCDPDRVAGECMADARRILRLVAREKKRPEMTTHDEMQEVVTAARAMSEATRDSIKIRKERIQLLAALARLDAKKTPS